MQIRQTRIINDFTTLTSEYIIHLDTKTTNDNSNNYKCYKSYKITRATLFWMRGNKRLAKFGSAMIDGKYKL